MLKVNHVQNAMIYTYIAISFIILMIHVITNITENALNLIIVAQFFLLVFLTSMVENFFENYWFLSFLVLYLSNYFTLPYVSDRYCIPQIDLASMSLVFLNTFLINAFSWLWFSLKKFCRDVFFHSWIIKVHKHFSVREKKKPRFQYYLVSLHPFSWAYAHLIIWLFKLCSERLRYFFVWPDGEWKFKWAIGKHF